MARQPISKLNSAPVVTLREKVPTPWRDKWQNAQFRGARFFVEQGAQMGGRRVALHQYPKRNVPYAEDMGKQANRFSVSGYCIGPDYLDAKDALIEALEKDGPGMLGACSAVQDARCLK